MHTNVDVYYPQCVGCCDVFCCCFLYQWPRLKVPALMWDLLLYLLCLTVLQSQNSEGKKMSCDICFCVNAEDVVSISFFFFFF